MCIRDRCYTDYLKMIFPSVSLSKRPHCKTKPATPHNAQREDQTGDLSHNRTNYKNRNKI